MKINFDNKSLKDYFESFDKEKLKKIYDDAVAYSLNKEKSASQHLDKN